MTYLKHYLNELHQNAYNSVEHQTVVQDLVDRVGREETLTIAEEFYICQTLASSVGTAAEVTIRPEKLTSCQNYWFRDRYLTYYKDLSCYGTFSDSQGTINEDQQIRDRKFIDNEFASWNSKVNSKAHSPLDQHLSNEVAMHIRLMNVYAASASLGYFRRLYLTRVIVLHSKFIYLKVLEYFQELGESNHEISLHNDIVVIDSYCYVHILFRHFARLLKEYQFDKTYHFDPNIDYNAIPKYILHIVNTFRNHTTAEQFNGRSIDYKLNDTIYSLWFRPMQIQLKGGIVRKFLRTQTHYPVTLSRELDRIGGLNKVVINESMSFFV